MQQRRLGSHGPTVSALGLGCMGMSGMYGPADRGESIATIHAALDAGITLIDTGDFYGMGHNELLIGEAVKAVPRDRLLVSVKFGALRDPAGGWSGVDGRPAAVKNFLAYSLQRLGLDHVDIYRPARLDPQVPIETWRWWRRCARSPRREASASPRRRSPGWRRGATTSSRWSAPAAATASPRRWARST